MNLSRGVYFTLPDKKCIFSLSILLQSPVFGLTFDVGHNHGCGNLDEAYIVKNKDHLCHMHMQDALGKKNHLAPGTGENECSPYGMRIKRLRNGSSEETQVIGGNMNIRKFCQATDLTKLEAFLREQYFTNRNMTSWLPERLHDLLYRLDVQHEDSGLEKSCDYIFIWEEKCQPLFERADDGRL